MTSLHVSRFGVIARIHARTRYTPLIAKQIADLAAKSGAEAHIVRVFSHATADAIKASQAFEAAGMVHDVEAPPVQQGGNSSWIATLTLANEALKDQGCQVGMVWDDDLVYSPGAIGELVAHFDLFEHDRVDSIWNMVWDENLKLVATHFPEHKAAAAYRIYPDDTWTGVLSRFVQGGDALCPTYTARSLRAACMASRAWHFGYASRDERVRCFQNAKRRGQIDAHYLSLVAPSPRLEHKPEMPSVEA